MSCTPIAEDSNDTIHVVLKDYVVKTLVIYEKSGNTTNNGQTLNPGEKPVDAQLVGSDLYINVIDNDTTAAANAATKVLKDAGYRRIDLIHGEAIDANGDYFYFDTITTNYYTLKVDGEVVEYIKKNAKSETTLGQIQGEGTGYIVNNSAPVVGYSAKNVKTEVVSNATAATVIETGYVNVTTTPGVTVAKTYAKAGAKLTVTATSVAANNKVTVTYTDGSDTKTVSGVNDTAAAANVELTITPKKDIVITNVATADNADYTVTAAVTGTAPAGLTVAVNPTTTTAKAGDKVTVTVTVKGDADATLTLTNGAWVSSTVPAGVNVSGSQLTFTAGVVYDAQIQYVVSVSGNVASTVAVA